MQPHPPTGIAGLQFRRLPVREVLALLRKWIYSRKPYKSIINRCEDSVTFSSCYVMIICVQFVQLFNIFSLLHNICIWQFQYKKEARERTSKEFLASQTITH